MIMKFRNNEAREELMYKVRKMGKYIKEMEECLEECMGESPEYREDDEDYKREGRYRYSGGYRRGM